MNHSSFGHFLEYSVPTDDIQASLSFYHALGFTELTVGDMRDYYYGVVTDGRIAIGLHAGHIKEPALTFINPDVAAYAQDIDADDLVFAETGSDNFNEIGLHTPDELLLVMMEARTFFVADFNDVESPVIGRSSEISLGYDDASFAISFWTAAGFTADDADEQQVSLLTPGLCLGLRDHLKPGATSLRFCPEDMDETCALLEQRGLNMRRHGERRTMTAPEGTQLELITRD
ncbi:MAG: hypothetical protein OEU86_02535 [Gammaproteobacteria bacterium]|nr:hypothetical protein [Gammaproteobacteria bacterium]